MTKIDGAKNIDKMMGGQVKLDSMKDVKDFLKGFSSIGEAKMAVAAILDEIKNIDPELARKLEKLLQALDKADKSGMTLDDFIENLEKMMGNDSAAVQGMSLIQQSQAVFNDNSAKVDPGRVNQTSSIA